MDAAVPRSDPGPARRADALRARRARLAPALAEATVLVPAGLPVAVEGSDQQHPYRGHDEHRYLAGWAAMGQVLVHDPAEGWTLYAPVADPEDRVWHDAPPSFEDLAEATGLARIRPRDELPAWLGGLGARPLVLLGSMDLLERPGGYGVPAALVEDLAFDAGASEAARAALVAARRRKDALELDQMRCAAAATAAGHGRALGRARPGWSERRLALEVEYGFGLAGAERAAYGTIAVCGERCAVLHAAPGAAPLAAGHLVLVDAGAEVEGYDCDVTRTWPVAARFSAEQRALYDVVLGVQEAAIGALAPGVEFRDLHLEAARGLAEGLVHLGLLRGEADGLVEQDAHAVFFPHGLGHLIGLSTHDVGGYPPGRVRSPRPGLKYLRIDLPMEADFVVTIEPGLYFVRPLLEDAAARERLGDAVAWDRARRWLPVGGVRIEDVVRVTPAGPEVLTAAIPKAPAALEAVRAEALGARG